SWESPRRSPEKTASEPRCSSEDDIKRREPQDPDRTSYKVKFKMPPKASAIALQIVIAWEAAGRGSCFASSSRPRPWTSGRLPWHRRRDGTGAADLRESTDVYSGRRSSK